MYAFYDSMRLDTNLQFDFLPINVKKSQNKQNNEDEMASHMEAYFNDQRLRQANKIQSEPRSISNDLSSISIEKSKKVFGAKRKEFEDRKEYFKIYKSKCRQNSAFKAKETVYQKNQSNLQEEILLLRPKKLCIRKNQSNLQGKTLALKERKEKQSNLQEEIIYLRPKKLCIRKNQSNLQEEILFLRPKKLCIRKNQSNLQGPCL